MPIWSSRRLDTTANLDATLISCHLPPVSCHFIVKLVLEGRRTASGASRGRKVRTPKGAMPRNSVAAVYDRRKTKIHAGGRLKDLSTDSATENQTAEIVAALCERRKKCDGHRPPLQLARVKRCGKSAPREAQATRHGKPHRVQGQIGNPGAARSRFRESETDSGYRLHRQMVLSIRKGEDRIRLTALPKPILQSGGASFMSPTTGRARHSVRAGA